MRFGTSGGLAEATVGPRVDRRRKLGELRTSARAKLLQLDQIFLGPSDRTELDHRFALDGDCIAVVRFEQERLLGEADRLAEQLLALGHPGERDIGRAVAGIDGKRGLEGLVGLDETARRKMRLALAKQAPPIAE